ncbi:MAG: amidase, partial [Rubrobacteraceae bacterium]|nr:amidase [Rubrobacteraceae bacterium]
MVSRKPSVGQVEEIGGRFGLHLEREDAASFAALMEATLSTSYRRLDELAEPVPRVKYPRSGGHRPDPAENPLGAWYYRCSIKGVGSGPLYGKRLAIKDNVCVAGVPMMNGSATLEGYVPEFDATIVT